MTENHHNTKRIAKNTIILYIRMIVIMIITLYTSRVVLKALGFDDYGLYNVVGGVVTLMAFLKSSMSESTQRFLSYEMGKGNFDNLKRVFSVCLTTHFLIALILLVLAETVGLWFLNTQINIPEGREVAANWIYQFSVVSLCISIISVPFSADIISHEKMGYFAFLSILEAILKLLFSFAITFTSSDKLILYGFLMMMVPVINIALNWSYCYKRHPETHYRFFWDKSMFKKIFSFSGWTIWGQLAIVGSNQGTNILVNIFHSVTANAAMGVGQQVNHAVAGLISNFQTAFKPQITKSYAAGDFKYLKTLTNYAAKISFYLFFIVSLPILLNIDYVLQWWLDDVPEYANAFCVIFIIASACNAMSAPLYMNIFSTGHIRDYQIAMSVAYIIELVLVYVIFKLGYPIVIGVAMKAFLNFIVIFLRMAYAHKEVESFSSIQYLRNVFLPIILSVVITLAIAYPLMRFAHGTWQIILSTLFVILLSLIAAFFIGLNGSERKSLTRVILKFVNHKKM